MATLRIKDGFITVETRLVGQEITLAAWRDGVRPEAGRFELSLPNTEDVEEIAEIITRFDATILEFPTFQDGRAYSQARILRERLGYKGEIRARGAVRSRQREADFASAQPQTQELTDTPDHLDPLRPLIGLLADWPTSQRSVLLLALHGLDREEIRCVLDLPDTALRQRLVAIRKRLVDSTLRTFCEPFQQWLGKQGGDDAGLRRAALARGPARITEFRLGVSDPDGHLLGLGAPRRPRR